MMLGALVVLLFVLILSTVFVFLLANYSSVKANELVKGSVLGSVFSDLSQFFKR